MHYMDGILKPAEEADLKEHMESCAECFEDFTAYSEILQGFNNMEIVEAPADFAPAVMAKIATLNLYAPKKGSIKERLVDVSIFAAWFILITILFGGIVFAIFGTQITEWTEAQGFETLANIMLPIADAMAGVAANIAQFASGLGTWSDGAMIIYSIAFFVLFALLVLAQMYIAPKHKRQEIEVRD